MAIESTSCRQNKPANSSLLQLVIHGINTLQTLLLFWLSVCFFCVFSILSMIFSGFIHHDLQSGTVLHPPHSLSFGSKDLLDVPLPLQVREPGEIISNDVMVLTSRTCDYHNSFVVRQLRDLLHGPRGANLAGVNQLIVSGLDLPNSIASGRS